MTVLNTLLEITIYSAVLFGAVWLFRLLMKKHLSPAMMYMAWFILIARLLMPVTITSGFSLFVIPAEADTVNAESVDMAELLEGLDNTVVLEQDVQTQTDSASKQYEKPLNQRADAAAETLAMPAANVPLKITWESALISLWLAGMTVMLIQMSVSTIRLKKRLKNAKSISPEWQRMAKDIESELGLRRRVRVVMIEGFPSPALSAGMRPVVVLPEELLNKSLESVRFALLHELTHIRRGDHIVSLLLLLLRAVYWFNPIVWLTAKHMRLDMETACDSSLTRQMSTSDRKQYAITILSMFARKQVRYVLGMALGQTKKTAERRLRGVFMRSKSSRRGKAMALSLAVVMLMVCFTTACQPTPEEPPVIPRSEDIPKEAILETATPPLEVKKDVEPADYSVNEHWAETVEENDFLSIEVDSDILMPEAAAYPVERLERVVLTQERVDELIAYFTEPGTKFYTGDYVKLKSEYEEELIYMKQNLQKVLNGGDGETPESIRSHIKEVERKLAEAPESHNYTYVEPVFTYRTDYETGEPREEYGENTISVSIESPDGSRYGSVSASRYEKGKNTSSSFSYSGFSGGWNIESYFIWYDEELRREMEDPRYEEMDDVEYKNDLIRQREFVDAGLKSMQENNMDLRAAADRAIKLLEELGIEGMQLKSYEKAMFSRERDDQEDYKIPGCYVEFVRECGGIPSLSQRGGSFSPKQDYSELYCAPFDLESLSLIISEEGVEYFSWRGMARVVERVAENTTLLPIDEIKQRILNHVFFMNAAWLDGERDTKRVKIEEVRLVTTYINAKDDPERVLIVPAWHIMAQEEYLFDQTDTWMQGNKDEFMINALDGSGILMPGIFEHMQNEQRRNTK